MPNPKGNPATLKHYTSKWKTGYTRTIRVPVKLADEILNYAHKLDEGEPLDILNSSVVTSREVINPEVYETLSQVIQVLESVCETPSTSKFTKALKAKIQAQAIEKLKALSQVNDVVELS